VLARKLGDVFEQKIAKDAKKMHPASRLRSLRSSVQEYICQTM